MKTSLLTALAATFLMGSAYADGLQDLERFLREVTGGSASFTQVVTSPKREGDTRARTKTSSGRFDFQRPNRFRFDYTRPFEQTIVADGQTLWLHDVDLNQVTARKQQDVLGSTPAALIAAGTDLKSLQGVFELAAQPDRDGLSWVEARPREKDGQLQRVRVGFRAGQLAVLEIADSLGQQSVLTFTQWQAGTALPAERFRFSPPAGADVIRP
ncbi:MAG: outer membrane lipoprotein chaperone LolA [Hydrogenophaga sp.]|nr:outer membrane lipoprotein chaperone LolA [Hydrogenophaga sp.]